MRNLTELLWWGRKTDGAALRVLMARELGPLKLAHRTELQAARRGGKGYRLPNGAAGQTNWNVVQPQR